MAPVMADGLNKVLLFGNIGQDPDLRMTPGGQSVLKLRLATTDSWLDKDGARQERTDWHSVSIWGKRGEALAKILGKGSQILVEGRIRTSSYEKDGVKKWSTDVIAEDVFLGSRRPAATIEPALGALPQPQAADEIPF